MSPAVTRYRLIPAGHIAPLLIRRDTLAHKLRLQHRIWHWLCCQLPCMNRSQITTLPSVSGLTWKQLSLIAASSLLIGVILALTIRLPVH